MFLSRAKQDITMFFIGGFSYCLLEILWRRYTHWTMLITGGICFLTLFKLYSIKPRMKLWKKCLLGSLIITFIELISGIIINIWLKMDVWDYSSIPINLFGQICLLYTVLWGFLCIPISLASKKIQDKYIK